MNKKTIRIAGWALGLSMAVAGIGAAVGMSNSYLDGPTEVVADATKVTYELTSKTTCSTTGTVPTGAGVTVNNNGVNNNDQMVSGKRMLWTLTGYNGKSIKKIEADLHRNSSKGTGTVSIANNSVDVGSYKTSYARGDLTSEYKTYTLYEGDFKVNGNVTITISGTENSIFCNKLYITWDEASVAASIEGPSTGKAGFLWAATGITEDVGGKTVTGATYSFAAVNLSGDPMDISDWIKDTAAGSITPKAPCTLTVSAEKEGYNIADKVVTVTYADAASVTLSYSSTTIPKGEVFDADDVGVTVNPSAYAEQTWTWSVTSAIKEDGETAMILDTDYSWDGTKNEILVDVAGTVILTATSGLQSANFTLNVSGDPILSLDKPTVTAYTIDTSFSLTATPTNFPDGAITYVWSSDNKSVVTAPDVATASNTISVKGAGTANVTVSGWVGGVKQDEATCVVTVVKTRSVEEDIIAEAVYDFSDVTATGTRIIPDTVSDINDYLAASSELAAPTISLPGYVEASTNYVYFGNENGGAYENQGGFLRIGKSKLGGSLKFDFEETITSVTVSAQKWTSNSEEGIIKINGDAPSTNAGQSSFANVTKEGLSTKEITIETENASARVFVNSITFRSVQNDVQYGRSEDVVNLEKFIDRYMHMDAVVDGEGMTGTNACLGWYDAAKDAYNGVSGEDKLNAHQRKLFATNSAYVAEKARLDAWAVAKGDTGINSTTHVLEANTGTVNAISVSTSNDSLPLILAIAAVGSAAAGGVFLISRKRREED